MINIVDFYSFATLFLFQVRNSLSHVFSRLCVTMMSIAEIKDAPLILLGVKEHTLNIKPIISC